MFAREPPCWDHSLHAHSHSRALRMVSSCPGPSACRCHRQNPPSSSFSSTSSLAPSEPLVAFFPADGAGSISWHVWPHSSPQTLPALSASSCILLSSFITLFETHLCTRVFPTQNIQTHGKVLTAEVLQSWPQKKKSTVVPESQVQPPALSFNHFYSHSLKINFKFQTSLVMGGGCCFGLVWVFLDLFWFVFYYSLSPG